MKNDTNTSLASATNAIITALGNSAGVTVTNAASVNQFRVVFSFELISPNDARLAAEKLASAFPLRVFRLKQREGSRSFAGQTVTYIIDDLVA